MFSDPELFSFFTFLVLLSLSLVPFVSWGEFKDQRINNSNPCISHLLSYFSFFLFLFFLCIFSHFLANQTSFGLLAGSYSFGFRNYYLSILLREERSSTFCPLLLFCLKLSEDCSPSNSKDVPHKQKTKKTLSSARGLFYFPVNCPNCPRLNSLLLGYYCN